MGERSIFSQSVRLLIQDGKPSYKQTSDKFAQLRKKPKTAVNIYTEHLVNLSDTNKTELIKICTKWYLKY